MLTGLTPWVLPVGLGLRGEEAHSSACHHNLRRGGQEQRCLVRQVELRCQGCLIQDFFLVTGAQFFLNMASFLCFCPSPLSFPQNCLALGIFSLRQVLSTWRAQQLLAYIPLAIPGSESHWNDLNPHSYHCDQGMRCLARSCVYPWIPAVRGIQPK